jgi:hypothetical protein
MYKTTKFIIKSIKGHSHTSINNPLQLFANIPATAIKPEMAIVNSVNAYSNENFNTKTLSIESQIVKKTAGSFKETVVYKNTIFHERTNKEQNRDILPSKR